MSPTIKRVLVANRGEIALRIIRACHEEGLEAVAVYSEVDRLAPHVRAAEVAVPIGAAPAPQSYLDGAKLIDAARRTGCQAIHPGYGFLSERAPFAEEAVPIGAAPAPQSYLDGAKLIDAARRTGCQAIHPGYGFLSERAPFAEAVTDAELVFVGPPAAAIRAM